MPQGNGTAFGFTSSELGPTAYAGINLLLLQNLFYTKTPLSGANVVWQWIIAVHTNGGNYAKLMIIANTGSLIGPLLSFCAGRNKSVECASDLAAGRF